MSQAFVTIDEVDQLVEPRFVDVRFLLTNPEWGYQQYQQAHIPGAIFADLNRDLSGEITSSSGRHPLPDLVAFYQWLEANGLDIDTAIVAYDNFRGGLAARLWWMLTQLGFSTVRIMTQGVEDWQAAGRELTSTNPQINPVSIKHRISSWHEGSYSIRTLEDLEMLVPSQYLIDSRTAERYRGETEPYDPVPGHIPGAVNLPWESHLNGDLPNLDKESIGKQIDLSELKEYTVYCGSGVTACFNLAVFAQLGLPKPALYPGSYSEWVRNHPDRIESA